MRKSTKRIAPFSGIVGVLSLIIVGDSVSAFVTFVLFGFLLVAGLAFATKWMMSRAMLRNARLLAANRERMRDVHPPNLWNDFPVSDAVRRAVDVARNGAREFVLARIDMSGRAYSEFGELPYLPSVGKEQFVRRDRYDIDVVLVDNAVLLRKDYRGDMSACLREWFNMEPLAGKARVPNVRRVKIEKAVLYMDFVFGRTMLEILRERGALMRDSDIETDATFLGLDEEQRQRKLDERATSVLPVCFSETFFAELAALIRTAHESRLTDLDIRFANIIVDDDGKPWMIDFHEAKRIPRWAEAIFRFKCEGDAQNYERVFGHPLTSASVATCTRDESRARELELH